LISRTSEEKFQHHGSVEKDLHHGSVEDYADPLLDIKDHKDSSNKRGEVPTPWKCGKVLKPWKHRRLC